MTDSVEVVDKYTRRAMTPLERKICQDIANYTNNDVRVVRMMFAACRSFDMVLKSIRISGYSSVPDDNPVEVLGRLMDGNLTPSSIKYLDRANKLLGGRDEPGDDFLND